jgi:[ribosomal protein S5]-alanine N-acetyltransferase
MALTVKSRKEKQEMKTADNHKTKSAETFGEMLRAFGVSVSEILEDPVVKERAKEFAESVVDAAAKVGQNRIKDEEARSRFRNVGKAAKTLGDSLDKHFKSAEEMKS